MQDLISLTGAELNALMVQIKKSGIHKSREQVKSEMEPVLNEMNRRGKLIAKKYGKKFHPVTFIEVMR